MDGDVVLHSYHRTQAAANKAAGRAFFEQNPWDLAAEELESLEVAEEGGRAEGGRAELRALTLGGAVWDAFRENANCGDPVGRLWVTSGYPVHFAGA